MTDLKKKHFYEEVIELLEEIEAAYDDAEFEVDDDYADDEEADSFAENDALIRFINHVKDAKKIAEENQ